MRNNWLLEALMPSERIAQVLCAFLVFAFGSVQAMAKPCVAPPATPEAISQFKAHPQTSIAPGTDPRTVENLVRDLAGTDASLAVELVHLAQGLPPRLQTAIAAGLAQAAIACTTVDQGAGLLIQQAVASYPEGQFQASFAAVAGDLSTAATDAANTAAAGSVGSVVVTNPTTSRSTATNPGITGGNTSILNGAPGAFALINSAATRTNGNTVSSSTTAASPVSATR
jgi:hypothetical protein